MVDTLDLYHLLRIRNDSLLAVWMRIIVKYVANRHAQRK